MSAKRKINFKFTHTDSGVHDIVYHPNGEQIITCGKDGFIRVSNIKDSDIDSPSIERTYPVNTVAVSRFGDKIACGTEEHEVALYSFPSLDFISLLGRFTLPVNHVAFNPSGSVAAAGGDEGSIKFIVVDTAQGTNVKAHNGPVLSLAFDPKGKYLASVGGDATLIIWDVSNGTNKLTSIPIAKVDPTVPYQRLRISWDNEGKYLAIPGEKDVVILERDTWQQCAVLKERHSSAVSLTAWSPSGRYLATCDLDSKLVVWDMSTKEDLESYSHTQTITGLAWNPIGNGIVVIDVEGKQGTWENVIPPNFPHPTSGMQAEIKKTQAVAAMIESERQEAESEAAAAAEEEEDEDEQTLDEGMARRRLKKRIADSEDDFVIPDGDVEMNDAEDKKKPKKEKVKFEKLERALAPQVHPPIQPGATPEGRKRRFLAYNMTGTIATREEEGFSAVEIEFADVNFHQKINITDHHNFTLGALNEYGAVFACRASLETVEGEESLVNSTIMFKPFNAWSNNGEWTQQLGPTEDAVCVGISKSCVLVATTQNYLRIFTHGSVQKAVMCIPGAPVCVCAEGDWAVVVYNAFPGLALMHINLQDGTTRYESGLPLSPSSTLTWVGFAGDTVCTADSKGIVRALMYVWRQSSAPPRWIPIMDFTTLRIMEGDTHWVVGVNEKQIMCIICKGDTAPTVLPRPVLSVVNLNIPLIHRGDTTEQEEEYMRNSLFLNGKYRQAMEKGESFETLDRPTAAVEASLIRLVQAACKKDYQARAFDYAAMLTLKKSINIAMKIAHTERRSVLKDKMGELMDGFDNRETKAELEMDKQQTRDQILYATAESVAQLEAQYAALHALAQGTRGDDAPSTNGVNGNHDKKEEANGKKKLRALESNGRKKKKEEEEEEEGEKEIKREKEKEEEDEEEPPARYQSPYESEEEEEEEKAEEKEEEKEEKPRSESSEENGDKEEEKKEEEEEDKKDEEEEEDKKTSKDQDEEPKKGAKGKKAAAVKKGKKDTEEGEKKEKKPKAKKAAEDGEKTKAKKNVSAKKGAGGKKKAAAAVDPDAPKPRNPFALKKHATTPKGQKEEEEEKQEKENERKRKDMGDKVTSPTQQKKSKQAKIDNFK